MGGEESIGLYKFFSREKIFFPAPVLFSDGRRLNFFAADDLFYQSGGFARFFKREKMRTLDEIEIDRKIFPHKAEPRGARFVRIGAADISGRNFQTAAKGGKSVSQRLVDPRFYLRVEKKLHAVLLFDRSVFDIIAQNVFIKGGEFFLSFKMLEGLFFRTPETAARVGLPDELSFSPAAGSFHQPESELAQTAHQWRIEQDELPVKLGPFDGQKKMQDAAEAVADADDLFRAPAFFDLGAELVLQKMPAVGHRKLRIMTVPFEKPDLEFVFETGKYLSISSRRKPVGMGEMDYRFI